MQTSQQIQGPENLKKNPEAKSRIDWIPFLFLTLTPLAAVISVSLYFWLETFSWWMVPIFLFFYAATAMSITAGYHRLFAHRAYAAPAWVRFLYAGFGAAAFQNSILKWAADHRIHHRYVDQDRDPYSISKGFWFAHIGWMCLNTPEDAETPRYQRDLRSDPIVAWQDKHYLAIAIAFGFVLPALLGQLLAGSWLGGLAIGGFLRLVAVHHATFFINSLCHWWGRQTYSDEHSAKDNWVAAFLTFGEGYHNFHHSFASDYRNGIKWYHWDPTKWLIQAKNKIGAAYNLKITPEDQWMKARLDMEEKHLRQKISPERFKNFEGTMLTMKARLEQSSARLQALRLDMERMKNQSLERSAEKLKETKLRLRQSRRELKRGWQACKQVIAATKRGLA